MRRQDTVLATNTPPAPSRPQQRKRCGGQEGARPRLTIGGQAAKVLYACTLGTHTTRRLFVVPDGVASEPQPVVLKVGANDNSPQKVTVWAK